MPRLVHNSYSDDICVYMCASDKLSSVNGLRYFLWNLRVLLPSIDSNATEMFPDPEI